MAKNSSQSIAMRRLGKVKPVAQKSSKVLNMLSRQEKPVAPVFQKSVADRGSVLQAAIAMAKEFAVAPLSILSSNNILRLVQFALFFVLLPVGFAALFVNFVPIQDGLIGAAFAFALIVFYIGMSFLTLMIRGLKQSTGVHRQNFNQMGLKKVQILRR